MLMKNPLKINDWEIKKFLTIIFVVQISLLGSIGLDLIGLKIPFLRELIAVIYLIFVPGFLILRILRLHKLSNIETLLFSVGLSITTLMFIGFLINVFYPFVGISNPISLLPLITTLTILVLLMSILSYLIDRNFADPSYIELNISPQFLFLCILPLMSILGSTVFYFYNKSMISILMIMIIVLIVLLIAFKKFITPKYYPLTIIVISISLLYHTWLISPFIFGRDIFTELSISNFVISNSYWNVNNIPLNLKYILPPNTSTMLITSIFAPIVTIIGNINLNNVYNIIFPLLISLTPLGLYELFKKQTNKQIAFLSVFLFVIMGFYNVVLISVKQSMATFFIVLLLLCFIRKNDKKTALLTILFLISIVTSHYGTTYLFLFIFIFALLLIVLIQNPKINNLISKFKFINLNFNKSYKSRINLTLVVLFLTFTLAWYIYVSQSHVFWSILNIGQHIITSIYGEFLSPESTEGLGLILTDPLTISGYFDKAIMLMIQFFILLGVLYVFLKDKMKFKVEFMFMAIPSLLLDIFAVIVPSFSSAIYTPRLYNLTLVFLAPFALIGGIYFFGKIKILMRSWTSGNSIKVLSVILVTLFLLEVGAVKEIVNEPGISIPLSKERMMSSDMKHKSTLYSDYDTFEQNYYSVNWLSNTKVNYVIFSDQPSAKAISTYNINLMLNWQEYFPSDYFNRVGKLNYNKSSYLYLSYSNIKGELWLNQIIDKNNPRMIQKMTPLFNNLNEIYSNGGSDVYIESP